MNRFSWAPRRRKRDRHNVSQRLFSPLRLGAIGLPHRIVMATLTRMRTDGMARRVRSTRSAHEKYGAIYGS
jgi:2,4-dienoyl-CoA reductase-like NADH-dependent reductase (Old Yellow Enzyme family)